MKEEFDFNEQFMNDLSHFFKDRQADNLIGQKSGHVMILLSEGNKWNDEEKKTALCEELLRLCMKKHDRFQFELGVSTGSPSLEDSGALLEEATACLKTTSANRSIVFFDSLGLVGILFQTRNFDGLRKFSYKILGNLIQEDKVKNNELIKTLYTI